MLKKMQQDLTTFDLTMLSSIMAFALSKVSMIVNDNDLMAVISGTSAVVLCLTAIIKFVDLVIEKYIKWKALRKPKS
jgi:hypothetical protein